MNNNNLEIIRHILEKNKIDFQEIKLDEFKKENNLELIGKIDNIIFFKNETSYFLKIENPYNENVLKIENKDNIETFFIKTIFNIFNYLAIVSLK
ncbi:MAG: hypothetical protein KatS3mg068_1568 [Candidatus Sericytochromatia bacterium]|nr:MAG: hypothetical protein KatS3mg068_1568 [Candidatus Sericytochromatia bacterium]